MGRAGEVRYQKVFNEKVCSDFDWYCTLEFLWNSIVFCLLSVIAASATRYGCCSFSLFRAKGNTASLFYVHSGPAAPISDTFMKTPSIKWNTSAWYIHSKSSKRTHGNTAFIPIPKYSTPRAFHTEHQTKVSQTSAVFLPFMTSATWGSHWLIVPAAVCGLVTAKQSKSHLCTLTGGAVSMLQPNYFTVREPQVVPRDRGVLVIHSLMMTYAFVLPKLTL